MYSLPQFHFRAVIQQGGPLASLSSWCTERPVSVRAAGNRHTDNLLMLYPLARNTARQKFRAKISSQNFTSRVYPEAVKSNYTVPADGIAHLETLDFSTLSIVQSSSHFHTLFP